MNKNYAIVVPCFNEEDVIVKFLDELNLQLCNSIYSFTIIIVDDYSIDLTLNLLKKYNCESDNVSLKVIQLRYNVGHQSAIRQGLIFASKINIDFCGVIVMDGDGEDDPKAILELIKIDDSEIVFVQRGKRSENLSFKIGYYFYRILFRFIIGKNISFGNYSLISLKVLKSIVGQNFFHYASFLSKQKFNIKKVKYDRKSRIDGESKMNYKSLIFHGLYSLLEYAEEVLFSLIKLFSLIFLSSVVLICYVLYSKFISLNAIPGWASSVGVNLMISSLVIISTIIIGLFLLSIKKTINQKNESHEEIY